MASASARWARWRIVQQHGIDGGVRIESGSFSEAVQGGGELYVLNLIIHDWPDERAVTILRNVRDAAGPVGQCCWWSG